MPIVTHFIATTVILFASLFGAAGVLILVIEQTGWRQIALPGFIAVVLFVLLVMRWLSRWPACCSQCGKTASYKNTSKATAQYQYTCRECGHIHKLPVFNRHSGP